MLALVLRVREVNQLERVARWRETVSAVIWAGLGGENGHERRRMTLQHARGELIYRVVPHREGYIGPDIQANVHHAIY